VRNYLRLALAEILSERLRRPVLDELSSVVLPNITFIDDGMIIDGVFYVEHGHRFDKYTNVQGDPVLAGGEELNIPFGSFMNRYLINFVELDYPYLDNVRPTTNILPLMIRERFPLALKLMFVHLPFMLRIIPKQYYDYMFRRVLVTFLAIGVPVAVLVAVEWPVVSRLVSHLGAGQSQSGISGGVREALVSFAANFGWLVASYILGRLVAYFHLDEPDSLAANGRDKFVEHPSYKIITFGHTHNPDQTLDDGRWFYNTGTWIPIVEISSAELREDKTYTVLRLEQGASGLESGGLFRWDDEAGRLDPALLVKQR
jgi:hypothetical protein